MGAPSSNQSKPQPSSFLQRPQTGSLEAARQCIVGSAITRTAFDELVEANCEDWLLLILLANAAIESPPLDTWKARVGYGDSRQLESAIKRIRQSADDFATLDRAGLLRLAAWPKYNGQLTPEQFCERVTGTPDFLRTCADSIEAAAQSHSFKPRAHSFSNTALAQLVAYVQCRTGGPHDSQVSSLLDALGKRGRNGDPYTAEALKTWRDEHARIIGDSSRMYPSLFGR